MWVLELNLNPLEELRVLITAEPLSLQSQYQLMAISLGD